MKCPYCEKEMQNGYIEADNLLSWTPENEVRKGLTKWAISPNGVKLADFYLMCSASVDAMYCSSCKKIIINVN